MAVVKKIQLGEDTLDISEFITKAVNDLTNYYTKIEVDQRISGLQFEIVETLPTEDIHTNVIYLLRRQSPEQRNVYDEYIYVNNQWENIGSTTVDLSNYYTKQQADSLLNNKVDKVSGKGLSSNDYTNSDKAIVDAVTTALNNKVDKVTGKGLSTEDYTSEDKDIVDGVTDALADKADKLPGGTTGQVLMKNSNTDYDVKWGNAALSSVEWGIITGDIDDQTDLSNALNEKVDKVTGKGLSTNDYTTADKTKLAGISSGAEANVQSDWSETDTSSDAYIANKPSTITVTTLDVDDTEKEFEIYGEEQ